jgi:hypothetical protein
MAAKHESDHHRECEHHLDDVEMPSSETAGTLTGAGTGFVVGGPVATTVGAGIGAVSDAAVEYENELEHAYDSHEPAFRREFESSPAAGTHVWHEASRAYRYGWESHDRPELQGKSWSQVCSDLKAGWTVGKWSDHEFLVRSAWERRSSYHGQESLPAVERFQRSKFGEVVKEKTPAFRFGQTLAHDPSHASDDWNAAEPEAREYWEAMNEGTWDEYKDAIHHAWDKARGNA